MALNFGGVWVISPMKLARHDSMAEKSGMPFFNMLGSQSSYSVISPSGSPVVEV